MAVRKVDGGVDGNGSIASFFFALIFFTRYQRAGQPLEETLCAALSFDVRDGSRNRHFGLAFQNVDIRGSKLPFAANDFALAEPTLDYRAARQHQNCSGDPLKDRYTPE